MAHGVTGGGASAAWFRAAGFLFILSAGLSLGAAEITWTGEGETSAWSDGGNWKGGTAPAKDDIAILPAGATVGATLADIDYMIASATKLGGIHFAGDDTVLIVTNLTTAKNFDIPLTGKGQFKVLGNTAKLNFKANNESYMGSFVISNSPVGYCNARCMGTTNRVEYWGTGSYNPGGYTRYLTFDAGTVSTNEFHLCGSEWLFYGANGAKVYGPVYLHGTARAEAAGGTAIFELLGGVYRVEGSSGSFKPGQNCRLGGNKPVRLGPNEILKPDRGVLRIATDIEQASMVCAPNTLQFERANCIPPTMKFRLGNSSAVGSANFNGHDQRCGDFAVLSDGKMNSNSTWLYSQAPATFTVCGTGPANYNGLLRGALSLEFNSTNSATAGSIGLSGTNNTTGALIARRGTINVLPAATFSNLTALVASNEGVINVQMAATFDKLETISVSGNGQINFSTACLNESLTALEVSDSGSVALGGGDFKFYSLKVDGRYLPVGNYEVGDQALGDAISGTGSISVFAKPVAPAGDYVWSGATSADMMVGANWDGGDLPDYEEGNATAVFDDAGTAAAEMTAAGTLNGIRFERGTSFSLGGSAPVELGAGGLSAENTAATGTVTNKIETTLHVGFLPQKQWSLGERTILDVRAPMTSIDLEGAEPVGVGGSGTVWLRASSPDLTAPLAFTNSMTRVLAPLALGSSNRAVTVSPGKIIFAGAGLTNDVPLRLVGGSTSVYLTDGYSTDQKFVQRGKVTVSGTSSIYVTCGNGYHFQGGLETESSGGFSFLLPANCHMYIEKEPVNCPSGGIYMDNGGHYHLVSTNNVCGTMQINVGTLHLDNDNVLCETGLLRYGVDWNDNFNGNVNLEGHENRIGRIVCGWTPSLKPTRIGKTFGASGTLEVVGATGSNLAISFQGGTSYKHSGTSTNVFWNGASTSTGRLEVVNGKVTFRNGAGWSAVKNVTISGTGVIGVQATSADVAFGPEAGRSRATLEFPDDTGTLEIESGTVTVRKLMIGGLYWGPGTYGASDLPSRISGGGSLRVLSGGGSILVVR